MSKIKILTKLKLFLKPIFGFCLIYIGIICLQTFNHNVIDQYEYNVKATVYEKIEQHYVIIYKTSNDVVFHIYTDPTTYVTSNIGDTKILKHVNKEKLNKETPDVLIYILISIFSFVFGGFFIVLSYFDLFDYIKNNKNDR